MIVTREFAAVPAGKTFQMEEKFVYKEGQKYYIQMMGRNKVVVQYLVIVRVEDNLHFGIQVFDSDKKIIYTNINNDVDEKVKNELEKAFAELKQKNRYVVIAN